MQDERILPLADCGAVGAYFAMVLIPGEGRRL
jgi:precorrin-2/cobalt-factor-2 C20-methyltransferase